MVVQSLIETLKAQDRFLILTHRRPDGDTIGCAAGLCAILRKMGKTAFCLHNPEATPVFASYLAPYVAQESYEPSYVITVDTADTKLLPTVAQPWLVRGIDLAIDHHVSHKPYAAQAYVDDNSAACGEIIAEIAQETGLLDPTIASLLYIAIATDTGCFCYANTTARSHRFAALMMEQGIDSVNLNRTHFQTKSSRRLKLEGMLIERTHLYDEGRLAVTALTQKMLADTSATDSDSEDVAPVIASLEGTLATVTLKETEQGYCKVSVRTNGLDASKICAQIGGGGHYGAAGGFLRLSVDEAEARMVEAYFQGSNR